MTAAQIVDVVVVDRLTAGWPVPAATPSERWAAIERLSRRGLSHREIAERIGATKRTVERHLARHRRHTLELGRSA